MTMKDTLEKTIIEYQKEHPIQISCKYCKNDGYYTPNKYLINRKLKNNVEVALCVEYKSKSLALYIENETEGIVTRKKINYCPMCGRKI